MLQAHNLLGIGILLLVVIAMLVFQNYVWKDGMKK